MSNVYDFNPSGMGPLARIIQSFVPSAPPYSPPTPPQNPDLTPADTAARIAGSAQPFSSLPPTGLADLAGRFAQAQGAQSVDESGMVFPPEQQPQQPQQPPQTTGAGVQPGQPSPMQPPRTYQFPPSQLPAAAPPADTTPPTADKAPPRQEPYIPSRRDAHPGAWGKSDLVEQGMVNYPGLLPGPYGAQPHEWQGIRQNSQRFLAGMGSGVVAPLAMALIGIGPEYWRARQAGNEHQARMFAANIALYSKQLALKQAQESRDYGEVFAALGPTDESGKPNPRYDENKLRQAILEVAGKWHDTQKISAALDSGGIPAVQRMIASRDASAKDHNKVQIQELRHWQIETARLRYEKAAREKREKQQQLLPWLIPAEGGTPAGALASVPSGGISTPRTSELDEYRTGEPTKTEPDTSEDRGDDTTSGTPSETERGDTDTDTEQTPETTTPEKQAAAKPPTATEQPETPTGQLLTAAQQPAATAQPTRLAMATPTGTVSDVPQPGELPRGERLPQARTAAAAEPPSATPAAGTPEAMGATAPVPSLGQPTTPTGRVPMEQGLPQVPAAAQEQPATEGAAAAPGYQWQPRHEVADKAAKMVIDTEQGRMRPNMGMVETLAQQMVNKTITIQQMRNYDPMIKSLATARGDEMIADMHAIAADPRLKTKDQILTAIKRAGNPEFAATLQGMVEGRFAPPVSAWANPGYRNRTVELGSKIDPGFNEQTAKTRARTLSDAGSGKLAVTLTANVTAYRHLWDLYDKLQNMPGPLARALGGIAYIGPLVATQEQRDAIGALRNSINTSLAEYERALIQAKPTVTGRAEQAQEVPFVYGDKDAMLGNIKDKILRLRDRTQELRGQFIAGTGMQPQAMLSRFEQAIRAGQRDTAVGNPAFNIGEVRPGTADDGTVLRQIMEGPRPFSGPPAKRSEPAAGSDMPPGWSFRER